MPDRAAGRPPPGYAIRDYREADAPRLIVIGVRAGRLFAEHGYPTVADEAMPSPEEFHAFALANAAWVAESGHGVPAGFAVAGAVGDGLHIMEISVDPRHGRQGVGGALLARVIAHARKQGLSTVTLSTFRDVPFNAPFYAARGFEELPLDAAPAALRARFFEEVPAGIDPATRLLMVHAL